MMLDGCKRWSMVGGLRSKWFWVEEKTMTMGAVYTFFSKEDSDSYRESDLFKSMWQTPIIDAKSIKIEFHENLKGGEITHSMTPWPKSQDLMPIV
jgi:hypothetical protein